MTATEKRIQQLARASLHPSFNELTGTLSETNLALWLESELGNVRALDEFSRHGDVESKAYAPKHILHVVSGNTPHAAVQSLLRGLLLGAKNTIKLPSRGLPQLVSWTDSLPDELSCLVRLISNIDTIEWNSADAVIAIGSDSTINSIQQHILPHQVFIPHGHKVSIGLVRDTSDDAATLAARDVSLYDQRGCLSLHAIYVDESAGISAIKFSHKLAAAMDVFAKNNPPEPLTLSDAGAIYNFRETLRYQASNSAATEMLESQGSLDWTVVYQENPTLQLSCLGRCVFVKPLPTHLNLSILGPEAHHLSTIALHPYDPLEAKKLTELPTTRVCPLGKSQQPSLFWHHDGFAPLASLVKWKDIG